MRSLVVGAVLIALETTASVHGQTAAVPCGGRLYRGFDSRLTGELLARIPEATKDFVGLEVDGAQVFLAASDALYTVDAGKIAVTRSTEPITAIAVDRQGDLLVQTQQTIRLIPRPPAKPFSVPAGHLVGRIVGSGAESFIEVRDEGGDRTLIVRRPNDFAPFPLVRLRGAKGPLAWTSTGATAIMNGSIVTMAVTDGRLAGADGERAFSDATDVAQLPDGRVVVALEHLLVLTGPTGRLVLAMIHAAARPAGQSLIVFDRDQGLLWRVSGLEQVGDVTADQRHAETLLAEWRRTRDLQVGLEAARILGCQVLASGAR